VSFPGFTAEQDNEVETLAKTLGADTLSEADRARIQRRVDEIAATVPDEVRPHHDEGVSLGPLWGAGLVGIIVLIRRE
jgi:hypothetical protein